VSSYDAVVLAGGRARRLDGVDKPMTPVAGTPMLARVVDAVAAARTIVVVGPRRQVALFGHHLQWIREDPPGGGPVAALAAGMSVFREPSPLVVVLAADLPFVATALPHLLAAAAGPDVDGAMLVDDGGRDQPLAAAYRRDVLLRQLATLPSTTGAAARDLVRSMDLVRVPGGDAAFDCDTWDDLRRAQERASGRPR
jgi:molybdopterin-guanine dinucleotide biosynthesis protein A